MKEQDWGHNDTFVGIVRLGIIGGMAVFGLLSLIAIIQGICKLISYIFGI